MTIIYEALYNHCIHESSYETLSLHKSEEGAKKAIEIHKAYTIKDNGRENTWEKWITRPTELKD